MARCDTCRFWDTDDPSLDRSGHPDDRQGTCRRRAPEPWASDYRYEVLRHLTHLSWKALGGGEFNEKEFNEWEDAAHYSCACWPQTRGSDWCGDYERGKFSKK